MMVYDKYNNNECKFSIFQVPSYNWESDCMLNTDLTTKPKINAYVNEERKREMENILN